MLCYFKNVKASAWKTIRKTQYDNYEDYFQVFRGFQQEKLPRESLIAFVRNCLSMVFHFSYDRKRVCSDLPIILELV